MGCSESSNKNPDPAKMEHKGNPKMMTSQGKEWEHLSISDKIKISVHDHQLQKMKDINDNTWKCDGSVVFKQGCYGGITDFYQTAGVQGWSCPKEECDFDICLSCVQYTKYVDDS